MHHPALTEVLLARSGISTLPGTVLVTELCCTSSLVISTRWRGGGTLANKGTANSKTSSSSVSSESGEQNISTVSVLNVKSVCCIKRSKKKIVDKDKKEALVKMASICGIIATERLTF
jgi:hypothetical protein